MTPQIYQSYHHHQIFMEDLYAEYQPLKWPPDMRLAELHIKCSCPGKDNIEGAECPCCGRNQKQKVKKWFFRDIIKDFKTYGGSVPAYFQLMKYAGVSLVILSAIIVFFHIYCLEKVCSSGRIKCPTFLYIFKFCDAATIYSTLRAQQLFTLANVFFWLQLGTFLYLILATMGMRWFVQYINSKKIVKEDKIYSLYSLMIKNIPLFYQIDDVRKQIEGIVPGAEICELFFVYEIAELEAKFKKLFDLHFQIELAKKNLAEDRGGTPQQVEQLKQTYIKLYEEVRELKKRISLNNGRAIIVFNSIQDRDKVYKQLKIGECQKLVYHTKKFLGRNTRDLHFFADKIAEPQEILWNYIGESSVSKTKVRIETTVIGVGFMALCFLILYFPIVYSDQAKIKDKGGIGSFLSLILALIIQILAIVYRLIIMRLIPSRQPSSRESESYFIVITTVIFHFFFYLVAPGSYFLLAYRIPDSVKLLQLFVTVLTFLTMTVIVAFIDLRYRLFNSRRKKVMSSYSEWGKYCQIRLHEQTRWPPFPIEFKLIVLLNIWSFNAFYVFQIPYLLITFVLVLFIVFWNDKKNIYKHYKMQAYLSIDLELTVLRDYIFMFLICVCCGYAVSVISHWQYIFIGIIFIFSIILNIMLTTQKKQKINSSQIMKTLTLAQMIKTQTNNPKQSMLHTIREAQLKESMFILDNNASTISIGSASYQYGYREVYDSFLAQFKNRAIWKLLDQTTKLYQRNPGDLITTSKSTSEEYRKMSKQSELQNFNINVKSPTNTKQELAAEGEDLIARRTENNSES